MSDADEWDIKNLKALKEQLRYLRNNRSWANIHLIPPLEKRIKRAESVRDRKDK